MIHCEYYQTHEISHKIILESLAVFKIARRHFEKFWLWIIDFFEIGRGTHFEKHRPKYGVVFPLRYSLEVINSSATHWKRSPSKPQGRK